jgi:hypothetical protein
VAEEAAVEAAGSAPAEVHGTSDAAAPPPSLIHVPEVVREWVGRGRRDARSHYLVGHHGGRPHTSPVTTAPVTIDA